MFLDQKCLNDGYIREECDFAWLWNAKSVVLLMSHTSLQDIANNAGIQQDDVLLEYLEEGGGERGGESFFLAVELKSVVLLMPCTRAYEKIGISTMGLVFDKLVFSICVELLELFLSFESNYI